MTDLAWKNQYRGVTGFAHFVRDERDLQRSVELRTDLDFGHFSPGFGTIVAHLRWDGNGSATFEGETGTQTLEKVPGMDDAEQTARVLAHWPGFTDAQRVVYERDRAFLRDNPEPRSSAARYSIYQEAGTTYFLSAHRHLVEAIAARKPIRFEPADGAKSGVAGMEWEEAGYVTFRSDIEVMTINKDQKPDRIADLWLTFAAEAARFADAVHEQAVRDWQAARVQAKRAA